MMFRIESIIFSLLLVCFIQVSTQGSSCFDRKEIENICTFNAGYCCNDDHPTYSSEVRLLNNTKLTCRRAREFFNGAESEDLTNEECNILLTRIEGSVFAPFCICQDKDDLGPCTKRSNGASFSLCNMGSRERECCPSFLGLRIPIPDNKNVPCEVANRSLYGARSSLWTDEECGSVKIAIEDVMFNINGCNCVDNPSPSPSETKRNEVSTGTPTLLPSRETSSLPSSSLSARPSSLPTQEQSMPPTQKQSMTPTQEQSMTPTQGQTMTPTQEQSMNPTQEQTMTPTQGQTMTSTQEQTMTPTQEQTMTPSLTNSMDPSGKSSSAPSSMKPATTLLTCNLRPTVDPICEFSEQNCCTDRAVRLPNGTYVQCFEALHLFSSDDTAIFSDNDCFLILLGIHNSLGESCTCVERTSVPTPMPQENSIPAPLISGAPVMNSLTCAERPDVKRNCTFNGPTCCTPERSGTVRLPNDTEVPCYQALEVFDSPESKLYDNNDCYLLLLGIETEPGESCSCRQTSNFPICFPGDSLVKVLNRGVVSMQELKIDDMVYTGSKEIYEPIYSFGHSKPDIQAEFLKISTYNTALEISAQHMVLTKANTFVPASVLKKGDILIDETGNEVVIHNIESVKSKGIYAPFTPSGQLVVNGIVVSSFIAFQNKSTVQILGNLSVSYQWIAQMFEFPHRVVCYYLGRCTNESYTGEGMSVWVAYPFHLGRWLLERQPDTWLKVIVLIMFFSLFCFFSILEIMLENPSIMITIIGVYALGFVLTTTNLKQRGKAI